MGIKHIVERNFSRHAGCYDAHTAIQKAIGTALIERLGPRSFERILDIGCGTGHYTRLLHGRYPAAQITAIDLSATMIDEARRKLATPSVEFIVADAETMQFDAPFDLITSNACFQWFANLDGTIARCDEALTEDGRLAFSSLGPRTFQELGDCLDAVLPGHPPISARSFAAKRDLEVVLQRHFSSRSVVAETMVEEYDSLLDLLNTIKYAGTRGSGLDGVTLTKALLRDLEETYNKQVGTIAATYDVVYSLAGKQEEPQP